MKILILGAGALGGYFGGRLLEAGMDVTFLLRENRIQQLQETQGLRIKSAYGDVHLPEFKYITSDQIQETYDLIIISCKAYSLAASMQAIEPAVGQDTMILPVLNGMGHINELSEYFGKEHVLGGVAIISATLDKDGRILHLNKNHQLTYGELDGKETPRMHALQEVLKKANFISEYTPNIMQAMWTKWVMIATAAGATCLFRCNIGDAVNAGAAPYITALFKECSDIAKAKGYGLDPAHYERNLSNMTSPENTLMASMLKDIEKGNDIELEAIIGKLIQTSDTPNELPMLTLVYTHLKAYLTRKSRETI